MARPAIEKVLCGMVIKLLSLRGDVLRIDVPYGRRATFAPLPFDGFQFDRINRHWIRSQIECSCRVNEILNLRKRASVPHLPRAIQICNTAFERRGSTEHITPING